MPDPIQPNKHWFDPFYKWRYGVPSDQKHEIALTGKMPDGSPIPGASDVSSSSNPADLDTAERRAAGYLWGRQHPYIAPVGTAIANALKSPVMKYTPGLGAIGNLISSPTESPEYANVATEATEAGVRDSFEEAEENSRVAAYQQRRPNPLATPNPQPSRPVPPYLR
jgi:hypothetical protein